MDALSRKHNDSTQNSSTYHKKDGTDVRAILKEETRREIDAALQAPGEPTMTRYLDSTFPKNAADRLFRQVERQIETNHGNLISIGADKMTVEIASGHLRDLVEQIRAETGHRDHASKARAGCPTAIRMMKA
ncbi:MAG: hypothetical protein KME20_26890 [Kaiparowitsia implicata GSE-PSE-MK54-09C]|jgi:hypothetical protein|nr:hypothetical protein [Kaiparowitsia implicata GSE-PSE-MK54-09C]